MGRTVFIAGIWETVEGWWTRWVGCERRKTMSSQVVVGKYNGITVCCKLVMSWAQPGHTNDDSRTTKTRLGSVCPSWMKHCWYFIHRTPDPFFLLTNNKSAFQGSVWWGRARSLPNVSRIAEQALGMYLSSFYQTPWECGEVFVNSTTNPVAAPLAPVLGSVLIIIEEIVRQNNHN
jgi:hypothetical protein